MTTIEVERLAIVETQQKDMTKAIEKLSTTLESLDKKVDTLNSKFDNLAGGKAVIIWLTGTIIATASLILGYIKINHK